MPSVRASAYRNLATMLSAGLPLGRSLQTAARGARGGLAEAMDEVAERIGAGASLSEAMSARPKQFRRLDVLIAEVGERSGGLAEAFEELSEYYEMTARLRRTILSGLVLPAAVLHAGAFIAPLPEVFLGGLSWDGYAATVIATLACFYVPALLIWAVVRYGPQSGTARRALDRLALKTPVLGGAVRSMALARFLRAFHLLFTAGIPIHRAIGQAASVTGNVVVGGWWRQAAESADQGRPAFQGLPAELPREIRDAWEVGEETGELDNTASRLANAYADKAERRFGALMVWLPRVLYVLIAIWLVIQILENFMRIYGGAI
ncbi:MAG: type II secretion system F family protein [Planctomycetota bacterium]